MELKFNPFLCPARLVAALALLSALPAAQAANGTWTGGNSTLWADTLNWSGGTVAGSTSANADIATFNSGTYANSPTAVNNYFLGGLSFGGSNGAITISTGINANRLNVDSGGIQVASGSSGAVTIGTASSAQGINLTASQAWTNNSTSLLTINRASVDDLAAAGTYTVTINGSGSGGVNVPGAIHDSTGNTSNATRNVAVIINSTGGATNFASGSTYSGGTTLTAGTLQIGVASVGSVGNITSSAIGTGTLALNGGTLSSGSGVARTILNALTIGGDVTLGDATNTGALTFSADAAIGSSNRILTTASAATFSGNITGTGGITKAGSGTLTYNGTTSNTYSGLTTVGAGSLTLAKTATVDAIAGDVLVNGTGNLTLGASDQIKNTSKVEIATGGTFNIGALTETVNGVKLTGGTITGSAGGVLTSTTAFDFQSSTNVTGSLAGTAGANKTTSGTVTFTGSNANTYTGLTTVSAGTLSLNKSAAVDALAADVLVNGTGTLTLNSANQIKDTANVEVATGGTFGIGGNNETVNGVKLTGGTITGTSSNLTSTTAFDFQSGTSSANLAGTAGATKTTSGTVTLSGANIYSGGTTLTAGTLQIGVASVGSVGAITSSAIGTGGLTLNGGTLSSGSGTARSILNAVTIGGNVTLGDGSNSGALTFSADANLGSSTRILTTASAVTFSGNITGTGGITKQGSSTLTFNGTTSNTYNGLTTVSSGTLTLAKTAGNAIAGNVLVNGGDVSVTVAGTQIADTATVEVSSGNFTIGNGLNETVATVKLTGGNIIAGNATSILTASTLFDLQSGTNTAILAGAGNATKSTSGTILLSKANTYSGGTTLTAGTLQIGVANVGSVGNITSSAIGTGTLALNGGTLSSGDTTARTILNALTIGGDVTLGNANTGALTFSADADLGGATRTLNTGNGSGATFTGIVSNGGIIKNGNGTLIIGSGNSTYSGGTTLNAGTLSFGTAKTGSVGNITSSSLGTGSLTLNGGTLTASSNAARSILNAVTVGGDVTFGDGVSNAILNFAAGIDLGGATRTLTIVTSSVTFSGVVANGGLTTAGNTLVLTVANTYTGATTINSGTLQIGSGGTGGSIDSTSSVTNNGALIYNRNNSFSASYAIGGTGTLEKQGNGTLTLTGSNGYTGATTITAGTLQVGAGTDAGSIANTSAITNNGSLVYNVGSGVRTLAAPISGTGSLTQNSSDGSLTLTGNNSFSGTTTVNGTLELKTSSGSALGQTSGITVNSGGTLLLSQSNQINNSATMGLAGGTIKFGSAVSEGSSGLVGVGALTLTANSTLDFNSLAGTITFSSFTPGAFTLAITNWTNGSSHLIFNQDESGALSSFTLNGGTAFQTSLGGGFYEIGITAVPEPGTIAAGLVLLGFVAWRERKRLTSLVRTKSHTGKMIS